MNYYNEIDPFAAAWLRELVKAGHIAPGEVDERDIRDICPDELMGYTQCHFFAGIGVWSRALRQAGWPDDREAWTGSCPCQPFSAAGKRGGTADERHLWPAWFHLISECRPAVIFGEQVEAAIKQNWLDLVQDDLEGIGYSVGAHGLAACHLGAPHIRKRLYFVADSEHSKRRTECQAIRDAYRWDGSRRCGNSGELADSDGRNSSPEGLQRGREYGLIKEDGSVDIVGDSNDPGSQERRVSGNGSDQRVTGKTGLDESLGESNSSGCTTRDLESIGTGAGSERPPQSSLPSGFWSNADWIFCTDQKYRPTKPGIFPLAHGITNRVGLLRGAGNAIVAPVAQAFIESYMEISR